MRDTYTRLFIHAVWATWDRAPLITAEIESAIYAEIRSECQKLRVELIEIGGVEDHIHVLVQLPAPVSVSELMKQIKGASSHLVTHEVSGGGNFKWQGAYAAFSVSETDLPAVRAYIRNQKKHHAQRTLRTELEIDEQ